LAAVQILLTGGVLTPVFALVVAGEQKTRAGATDSGGGALVAS
jgi:hypothetical protein